MAYKATYFEGAMSKTALFHLVGEQPIPNLLTTRHLRPDVVVLIHTDRTKEDAESLKNILSGYLCYLYGVEPYNLLNIHNALQQFIDQRLIGYQLLFNLTGGTKPMSIAALLIALQRNVPFLYFQTEGGRSLLYRYQFANQGEMQLQQQQEEIRETLRLDDYLRAYVGSYTTEELRNPFEQEVYRVLCGIDGIEILTSVRLRAALEVDFIIRLGNQVGVVEAKTKGGKAGIDQIQAVADQRYLGTYVSKFLVSGSIVDQNNKDLAKAYKIEVIELTSFTINNSLSESDKEELKRRIIEKLKRG